jgi:peptidyl-prolyl cis-trans isomerase C
MLRTIFCCVLTVFIVTSCSKKPKEGIALIVNGYEIPTVQVMQTAELLRESMIAAYPEKAVEGINGELLAGAAQQLIAHRLLIEEAQKRGITADTAEIDSLYGMLRSRAPDQAAFERELIKMGETDSSLRQQIGEGVRLEKLMKELFAAGRQVDSQECRDFYEKNREQYTATARIRANQIFLPYPEGAQDNDKQSLLTTAREIRQKIIGGTPFADLAKKHSKGPGALEGGDIGWFGKGDLKKELDEPLFLLKKGETSNIIPTEVGLFILQKTDEEPEKQQSYEEVAQRIRFLLEIKERNKQIGEHLEDLKKRAKIEFIDTSLAQAPELSTPELLQGLPQ